MYRVISQHEILITNVRSAFKTNTTYQWITPYKTKKAATEAATRIKRGFYTLDVKVEKV